MRAARLPVAQALMRAPYLVDAFKQGAGSSTRISSPSLAGRGRLTGHSSASAVASSSAGPSPCKPRYQAWGSHNPLPLATSTSSWQQCRALSSSQGSSDSSREQPPEPSSSGQSNGVTFTLPTLLTLGRVVAIPFLIAAWYWRSPLSTPVVTGIFVAASLTDWLDGYLARKLNAHSRFGAFLDPVADKLMVSTLLVLLSTQPLAAGPLAGNDWLVPVCTLAILGREITMSALREWAATLGGEARKAVDVSAMGKWKTATQMVSLALLLLCRDGGSGTLATVSATLGPGLLLVATYLTLASLASYLRALWRFMV